MKLLMPKQSLSDAATALTSASLDMSKRVQIESAIAGKEGPKPGFSGSGM